MAMHTDPVDTNIKKIWTSLDALFLPLFNDFLNNKNLPKISTDKDMKDVLGLFFDQAKKKDDLDRHIATRKLNACRPTENSKALVIAFEATGAYEPLILAIMARFNKCFGGKIDKAISIRPKVVLTSHSSGGRSLVKFQSI
jgi:hypothetical protein